MESSPVTKWRVQMMRMSGVLGLRWDGEPRGRSGRSALVLRHLVGCAHAVPPPIRLRWFVACARRQLGMPAQRRQDHHGSLEPGRWTPCVDAGAVRAVVSLPGAAEQSGRCRPPDGNRITVPDAIPMPC